MKIVVVNYDELNQRKNSEDVIGDVVLFFERCSEADREELGSALRGQLEELAENRKAMVEFADTSDDLKRVYLTENLKKMEIDLLVTYNLAGFELSTLTDGLAYNLVDCRQLHLISREDLISEKYLEKDKSINMFFGKIS